MRPQGDAVWLGSALGQAGIVVAAIVLAVLLLLERWLFERSPRRAFLALGLGLPRGNGLWVALAITTLMLGFFPLFAWRTATPLALHPGWFLLLPGLFAQGGIAEEALFRGYLFGQLRESRGFWRAALLSVPSFFLVHLLLLATMP